MPPTGSVKRNLYAQLLARYSDAVLTLPPELVKPAFRHPAFFGKILTDKGQDGLPIPASVTLPLLFWEQFYTLEEDVFLDIAEAGALLFIGSVLLDHIVDNEIPDRSEFILIERSFSERGMRGFQRLFPAGSPFWTHFDRLQAAHRSGLAQELSNQRPPYAFSREAAFQIPVCKVGPAVTTLAALCTAYDTADLLAPIEKSLRHYAIALQFADDLQDWPQDLERGHLTYFLRSLLPGDRWPPEDAEAAARFARTVPSQPALLEHWKICISQFDLSMEAVHDLACPGWSDQVFEQRTRSDALWSKATAAFAVRALESSNSAAPRPLRKTGNTFRKRPHLDAVDRAIQAVIAHQNPAGAWTEFRFPNAGSSDAWVTAHIGARLADLPGPRRSASTIRAVDAAAAYLLKNWHHGWGYNAHIPVDADSTAHALRFFRTIERPVPSSTFGTLLQHQQPDGGFATYNRVRYPHLAESWCVSHPDVTAMTAFALAPRSGDPAVRTALSRAVGRMEADRLPSGRWPAFWWDLNWYTTLIWMQACRALGRPLPGINFPPIDRIDETCRSLLDRTILLEICLLTGESGMAQQLYSRLLDEQLDSGLWHVEPALYWPKIGSEDTASQDDRETHYPEIHGIYTTATVLHSLVQWEEAKHGRQVR